MHTSLLDVVVSPEDDSDTLNNLLIVGFLVDTVSGCNVGDAYIFNSQTVNALIRSFDDRPLLYQKVGGVIPVASLVHLHGYLDALLLKSQLIKSILKPANHNVVHTLLIARNFFELYFAKQVRSVLIGVLCVL